MSAQLLLLIGYSAALIGLGMWIGRRVDSARQFFVAGRELGPLLLFATILAANIGAGTTMGAASLGYRDGLSAWWWVGSAGLGTLLMSCSLGPRIWSHAREHDLRTVGDYLEWRYGPGVRCVTATLLWFASLTALSAQLVAVAFVLHAVAEVPAVVGCVLGGLLVTVYFTAGGLVTSAWVNMVQLVVLLSGFALALPIAMTAAGGWPSIVAAAPGDSSDFFSWTQGGASGWHYMALLIPSFMVSPGLLQKVYGARSARTVRIGAGASALALLVFAAVPPLFGMLARVHDPTLTGNEINLALPVVLTVGLPLAIGTLGLAAVFSAEVSSADAVLFMLSTSLSEDLYRRFLDPEAGERRVLRVARYGAAAGGILATLLAIALGSVIESITIFYSLLSMSLFIPIVGGVYWARAGSRDAIAAIVAGVGVYVTAKYVVEIPSTGLWNPNSVGLLASAVAFAVSVWLTSGRRLRAEEGE